MNFNHLIPQWLRAKLQNPPANGTGIHWWLFNCACCLRSYVPKSTAHELLTDAALMCDRDVPPTEISDAIANAKPAFSASRRHSALIVMLGQSNTSEKAVLTRRRVKADWEEIRRIAELGEGVEHLATSSPDRQQRTPGEYLKLLFPGNPHICIANRDPREAITDRLTNWLRRSDKLSHALIVPSAMTASTGKTKIGKTSRRCLDNTGPRQYQVVEFDFAFDAEGMPATAMGALLSQLSLEAVPRSFKDLCAALILELQRRGAPLLMVVDSGGRSLHAWFPVGECSEADVQEFFGQCLTLGADPATLCACQMVRLPEGRRITNGASVRQRVLYFNPTLLPKFTPSNPS